MNHNTQSTALRITMAVSLAMMITILLILVMNSLISSKYGPLIDTTKRRPLPPFVRVPIDDQELTPPLVRKPDPPIEQPPEPEFADPDTLEPQISRFSGPRQYSNPPGGESILQPTVNTELLAIVDMQPVYPHRARQKGIEGYVIVEFSVSATGSTGNIIILEAYPERVFDRAAIRTASKSRFKPRIVDGKPVAVNGLRKKYTFRFDE